MGPMPILCAATLITAATAGDPGTPPLPPPHIRELRQADGPRETRWDAFRIAPGDPAMPSVSGSLGRGGAMLRLEWH